LICLAVGAWRLQCFESMIDMVNSVTFRQFHRDAWYFCDWIAPLFESTLSIPWRPPGPPSNSPLGENQTTCSCTRLRLYNLFALSILYSVERSEVKRRRISQTKELSGPAHAVRHSRRRSRKSRTHWSLAFVSSSSSPSTATR